MKKLKYIFFILAFVCLSAGNFLERENVFAAADNSMTVSITSYRTDGYELYSDYYLEHFLVGQYFYGDVFNSIGTNLGDIELHKVGVFLCSINDGGAIPSYRYKTSNNFNGSVYESTSYNMTFIGFDSVGYSVYAIQFLGGIGGFTSRDISSYVGFSGTIPDSASSINLSNNAIHKKFFIDLWNQYYHSVASDNIVVDRPSYDSDSSVFDSSLGYIQNLKRASLALGVSGGQTNRGFYYDRFNFSTVTSSGRQIFDDGFDVQYGFSAQSSYRNEPYLSVVSDYYYLSDNDLCPPASLSNGSDDIYNSLLLGRLWVSKDDRAYADIVDQSLDGLNFIQNLSSSVKVQLWLRPVYFDGTNSSYGEWTVYQFESSSSYSGTTSDGGIAEDGRLDSQSDNSNVTNSTGIGQTVEDAGSSASSPNIVDVDLSDVPAVVGQFTESLTAFGGLFAAFFSFLPPWVTFMFIAALSVSAIMIVWKAVH